MGAVDGKVPQVIYICLLEEENLVLSFPRNLMWPGGESNMLLHRCVHITISHQLAKFHGHRPFQGEFLVLLICHVTTDYHVKESCDSMWLSRTISHQIAMFGSHRKSSERRDIGFQFVTWPNAMHHVIHLIHHVIRQLSEIIGKFPSS